ncbi:MAG: thymidylate kinase, partial [Pseudomonadota bacterium]|nr:thymidylate kinase [Pseudomonadota bacterium]
MFITFEGGEGTGKSTQVKLLAEHMRVQGKDVLTTREPGGTPEAEALRSLLVSGEPGRWTADEELLLNFAARGSHLRQVIKPALA